VRTSISSGFLRAAKAQETDETFALLVTFEHEDLPEPIRLNNTAVNIVSRGDTYYACFLEASLLDDDPERPPRAQLSISNIDRTVIAALRETHKAARVTLELIRVSNPDYVEARQENLELVNVTYDALIIRGDLFPSKIKARPAIDYGFTPNYAPGLF